MNKLNLQTLIDAALAEDMASQDLTAQATIHATQQGKAVITAKANGILSGCMVAAQVITTMDQSIEQTWFKADADHIKVGDSICELTGNMRSLLSAERTALNFMQHLSGIASATYTFTKILAGSSCSVVDTRKTTPGLRKLEKQAVLHGGGKNHRLDLASGMLIKENHIEAAGSITLAIAACKALSPQTWVEVECETVAEVCEAIKSNPDMILLDNMDVSTVSHACTLIPAPITIEASGNITTKNALAYASTGIHRIAVGAITHSAQALDLSMRLSRI